jgi:hypothetical protein
MLDAQLVQRFVDATPRDDNGRLLSGPLISRRVGRLVRGL